MPKGDDVESTDISITESQFSSTMPYCEESLVAKLDPLGESQFLSAQPCHKEETTLPHESADLVTEERTSDVSTKDCSSGTSASTIPAEDTHVKFDSVSDINTESQVDHGNLQSGDISNIEDLHLCQLGRVHLIMTLSLLSRLKLVNLLNLLNLAPHLLN